MFTKLFKSSLVVLLVVAGIYAAPASYSATDAVYEYGGLDYNIASGAFDTLVGVDSTTLVTGRIFSPDWQYVLVRGNVTGTGSDSVAMQVRVDALNETGTLIYSTLVDSLTAAAGEQIFLPIFGSIIGSKIRIKLIGYTGNGGQVILNNLAIYKRRPVTINKAWK